MRVLICAAGTVGDVHPLVGIASAMRSRGHEVILLANPAYASLAQETGISFEPIGREEQLAELKSDSRAWTYSGGWKVWTTGAGLAPMRELYQAIEKLNQPRRTAVAASYLCFGARIANEKLNIPTATLHLNVHTIRSAYGIYAYPPPECLPDGLLPSIALSQRFPRWCHRAALWLADATTSEPVLSEPIRRFRKELGLPAMREFVRDWWTSPDLGIGLFPDWWAGEHPDWPPQLVTTGFPFWDRSAFQSISDPVQQWIDESGKVLVYTPGASAGHTESHFRSFAGACESMGLRGLILTPNPPENPISPDRIRFERFIPFGRLLPHATAVVHHAGIGTSAQCLAAGVPQVVVPTIYNQPDTAIRLERLGVARKIRPQKFRESTLTSALQQVLKTAPSSCREIADLMRDNDPLPQICAQLESLLKPGLPD